LKLGENTQNFAGKGEFLRSFGSSALKQAVSISIGPNERAHRRTTQNPSRALQILSIIPDQIIGFIQANNTGIVFLIEATPNDQAIRYTSERPVKLTKYTTEKKDRSHTVS